MFWNGYGWWSQANKVTIDEEQAHSVDEDWSDTTRQPTLTQTGDPEKIPIKDDASLEKGGKIGELIIPELGKTFPVHLGTDDKSLKKGVGLYDTPQTVLPHKRGHTALAGHRDTVFVGLDELIEGDKIHLKIDNVQYEYQIRKTWITDAEDRSVIVEKELPTLTLTTCYPFDFIGSAPDRYIVESELIGKEMIGS